MKGDKEDSGEQHRPWRKILREETVQVSQIQIIYRGVCVGGADQLKGNFQPARKL